jgi:hypothetical protein
MDQAAQEMAHCYHHEGYQEHEPSESHFLQLFVFFVNFVVKHLCS